MNGFDVKVRKAVSGFHALVRMASDAELRPIVEKGGRPRVFPTEIEALRAGVDNLISYINGNYVRDGEIAGETSAAAQAHFTPAMSKPRTRVITVSYKGRRAHGGR